MTERMKDFNVKLTVRSARLLDAIVEKFGSQMQMARETGISQPAINAFVTMKRSPVNSKNWSKSALDIAAALGKYPQDLWPEHLRDVRLKQATAELHLSVDEVKEITGGSNIGQKMLIDKAMSQIPADSRHLAAVMMQLEGKTFDGIGKEFGVTRERARQIYERGLRILKHNMIKMGVRELNDALEEYQ